MPNKYGHKNYLCYIINFFGATNIAINMPKQLFLTLMLVFMANNDANNGKLVLHGLSSLIFTMPAMENGEKSKSECPLLESHCWYIQDIYLKVRVSIIICHEDPQRTSKQLILVCFWQC